MSERDEQPERMLVRRMLVNDCDVLAFDNMHSVWAVDSVAASILASGWLRAHDDRIRAEALADVLALADEWEGWDGTRPHPGESSPRQREQLRAALRAAAGTPTHHNQEEGT
jgi:hypothetical protein